jgi:SAM-dependent methyltransferase
VARQFVDWLDVPEGKRFLDVGCGTGALSQAILAACSPVEVVGVDPSLPFVAHAATQVPDARASFRKGDAERLPVDHGSFDAVVSGLVLNFVPDQPAALREMRRAVRPGGVVAAYVWDYADGMQLIAHFWDAAVEAAPEAGALHEGLRFARCRPEPLGELFLDAGLADVAVEEIVVPTAFADFDDYWAPFVGGQGPAPAYTMSLPEEDRAALRERLRDRLPIEDDGSIRLTARAWAVRGTLASS